MWNKARPGVKAGSQSDYFAAMCICSVEVRLLRVEVEAASAGMKRAAAESVPDSQLS